MAAVLDHGYVKLIDKWGSDEAIIEAARMSTGKGFLGWGPGPCPTCFGTGKDQAHYDMKSCQDCKGKGDIPGDLKLLRYLYTERPQHSTPFEMAGMVVEDAAPIMVYREWHRHRTQSYNEMSGRYVALPDVNYVPTVERLMVNNADRNKQVAAVEGAPPVTPEVAEWFRSRLRQEYESQQRLYEEALAKGIPKELARLPIGVGRYSRMRASANLLNWLKFLTLRMHRKAQWEIRQHANAVAELVRTHFPRTYALFEEERPK